MREILFRGKASTEWVYGDLRHINDGRVAVRKDGEIYPYEVIPETVGQYTGLKDKKGRRIFEGDIVHAVYKSGYTGIPDKDSGIGVIKYSATYYGGAAYQVDLIGEPGCRIFSASLQVEVIGNIHENPELLKGE